MNYGKLLGFYLTGAIITTIISFVVYCVVRFICDTLKEKEPEVGSVR